VKKLFRWFIVFLLVSSILGISAVGITYLIFEPDLPDVETLRDVQLQVPLRVFSEDGKLLGIFGEKRRIPVTVQEMPDTLKQAFLAGEDARFYEHPGLDYQGITRAVWSLLAAGRVVHWRQYHHPAACKEPVSDAGAHVGPENP